MKEYQHIIDEGIRVAKEGVGKGNGGPFGAVVFHTQTKEILSSSSNCVIIHSDPTAHAEVSAIRLACAKRVGKVDNPYELNGYSLYATGQPCPMCLAAICWARLDAYYYTTTYDEASQIGFDDAPIRDSMTGKSSPLVEGKHWANKEMQKFFLGYNGKMY